MIQPIRAYYHLLKSTEQLEFHTHDEHEIYMLHEGDCRFQIGDQIFDVQPGDILMIDHQVVHRAFVDLDKGDYRRSVIHIDPVWLDETLSENNVTGLAELFSREQGILFRMKDEAVIEKLSSIVKDIAAVDQSDEESEYKSLLLRIKVIELLILIADSERLMAFELYDQAPEKLEKVQMVAEYIIKNYQESLTLDDIADGVNVSKSYLSALFAETTGMTIIDFLMSYRLYQAKLHLVHNKDLSINELANLCGFKSHAHFSRFFKREVGMTPSEYRIHNNVE